MATYTDLFLAEPHEIAHLVFPQDIEQRPKLLANGILPNSLADLDFILTRATDREPRLVRDSDDLQVYELSSEFVSALSVLQDSRLLEIAGEWTDADDAFLRELRALAQLAVKSGQTIYMYL